MSAAMLAAPSGSNTGSVRPSNSSVFTDPKPNAFGGISAMIASGRSSASGVIVAEHGIERRALRAGRHDLLHL